MFTSFELLFSDSLYLIRSFAEATVGSSTLDLNLLIHFILLSAAHNTYEYVLFILYKLTNNVKRFEASIEYCTHISVPM